jgi:hypothetical protein
MMRYIKQHILEHNDDGMSLIEILLYLALLGAVTLAVSSLLSVVISTRERYSSIAEVEQAGTLVMQRITQEVRNAKSITSPAAGSAAQPELTLVPQIVGRNPVLIRVQSGAITLTESTGSGIPLSSDNVVATQISFQNTGTATTPGTIRISFTLSHINANGRSEGRYSQEFTGTAVIRSY